MPSVKNETKLAQIKEDLEGAGAVWVVDACGLTVKETQALRQAVREAGASMKVYKNTLMHIALADAELPTLDDMLHGPSAFVFAGDDVAAAAKAVKEFSKTNETLEIKGGLMEGAAVSQVAARNGVPCVILRAMSDNADESGYEVLVVKKFSIGEYIKTATAIVANMIEAL